MVCQYKNGYRCVICIQGTLVKTYHVFDRSSNSIGLDSVDFAKRKAEEAITCTLGELRGELACKFDGLVLNAEASQRDVVCADDA